MIDYRTAMSVIDLRSKEFSGQAAELTALVEAVDAKLSACNFVGEFWIKGQLGYDLGISRTSKNRRPGLCCRDNDKNVKGVLVNGEVGVTTKALLAKLIPDLLAQYSQFIEERTQLCAKAIESLTAAGVEIDRREDRVE